MSLLSVGSLVGALVSGGFSDIVGRKPAVMLGACITAVSGVLHAGAVNLW